jgi:hypothetical protein
MLKKIEELKGTEQRLLNDCEETEKRLRHLRVRQNKFFNAVSENLVLSAGG